MPWTSETLPSLRDALKDRWESVPFWTDDEARLALNEALCCWNLLTGYWRTTITIDARPDEPFHVLPTAITFRTRVLSGTSPLAIASLVDLSRGRPGWWTETVADGGVVPTIPKVWAPVSLQLIAVWPTPAAYLANGFTVEGIAATPQLSGESDTVDLEEGVLGVILDYALHVAAFKEGWARFVATSPLFRGFLEMAAEENSQLKASSLYRAYMGLDRNRDFKRTRRVDERLSDLVAGLGAPTG